MWASRAKSTHARFPAVASSSSAQNISSVTSVAFTRMRSPSRARSATRSSRGTTISTNTCAFTDPPRLPPWLLKRRQLVKMLVVTTDRPLPPLAMTLHPVLLRSPLRVTVACVATLSSRRVRQATMMRWRPRARTRAPSRGDGRPTPRRQRSILRCSTSMMGAQWKMGTCSSFRFDTMTRRFRSPPPPSPRSCSPHPLSPCLLVP